MNISNKVVFRTMRVEDQNVIASMMKALYRSLHAPDNYMTDKKIAATFEQLHVQPEYLKLDVFEVDGKIAGYALLFKFWYNEFGGTVWNIDELFVQSEFQRQGISSLYLSSLNKRTADRVALSLEVLPQNKGAYDLYKRKGFQEKETVTLYKLLE